MNVLYDTVCNKVLSCNANDHSHMFSDSNITYAIGKLKRGKSDGYDGLSSDYIINGTPTLFNYISILFSLMLSHCCVPDSFCVSTMVPIPKGSGSTADMKNYRGIALSSLFSKLFDTCTIVSVLHLALMTYSMLISKKHQQSNVYLR